MPRIPKIESTRELTAQPPSTLREAASYAGKTVRGRTLQQTGEFLSRVGQYFEKIMDTHQYTQAQTESVKRLNDLYNKIQTDPETDIWMAGKTAQEEMAKIKNEASSKILNQLVREKFNADFELDSMRTTNAINDYLRKRQADGLTASALEFMDTNTQAYFEAPSDAEQQMIKANMKAKVDELVNLGVWEKEKAYKLWAKTEADLRTGQVEYDIANDTVTQEEDSIILSELKKGKQGLYPDLLQDERLDLIKKSQQRIFNNNQTYKRDLSEAQENRHSAILDKLSTNTLTLRDIEDELIIPEETGGIKRKILLSYRNAIERRIEADLRKITSEKDSRGKPTDRAKNSKKYLNLIDKFIDDESDLWEAREFLADAYGDGIINSKEAKYLNELRGNLNDIKWNRQAGIIKSTVEWTKNRLKVQSNPSDWEIALRIKQLLNEIQEGKDPQEAANQVISDQIDSDIIKSSKEQPQRRIFANNPETGQRIYSDDGGETWHDEKTGEQIK